MDDRDIRALIEAAFRGDREAVRRLAALLRPEIVAEVGHTLARLAPVQGRSPTQERDDLVQHVFLVLWDRNGELLKRWDPERGRSLTSYVRLVARSRALDVLRSRTRNPWQLQSMEDDGEDESGPVQPASQAATLEAREQLAQVQGLLAKEFSDRDWHLFYALLVEDRQPKDIAPELCMTTAAVYQWKSRFGRGTLQDIIRAVSRNGTHGAPAAAVAPDAAGPAAPAQPRGTIAGVREDTADA